MLIGDRIKQIREKLKLSQKNFAGKIGISQAAIQVYEYNKSIPNALILQKICEEFNVNPSWLLLGTGSPFNENEPSPQYTPYEMLLSEILHRIGYYEQDFTPEQLATLTKTVEREVKGLMWDLQEKIFALIRSWKK